jgi:drug/metabolite transporter (DMT)-like permease
MTRMLAGTDSSETTLFYANLFGCVVMAPVLPFIWTSPPTWLDVALMLALGVFGAGGHFLLILAHRRAPASVLSPFIYTQIVWASMFGYLVFANVPSHWTLAGAAIVIASGLYLLNRERKVRGAVAPIEPG